MWRKLELSNALSYTHTVRNEGLKPVVMKPLWMWLPEIIGCDRVSVTDMTEIRGWKLHWATLTLIKEIGIKLGVLKLSGMWQTFNVCDLLNHHGCDRVSVTDMTEIRGGKLHWARCTHSKVIGMKPVVLKLFGMWKKSLICIWNTVRGKGGLL